MSRSSDEQEIRTEVVSVLRRLRPNSRIIHEINFMGGVNRIDVMCVGVSEIISVEIKSKKDKLTRAPAQISSMNRCSHTSIIAFHEKFLVEKTTNQWAAHYSRDGVFYRGDTPDECGGATAWVYPQRIRCERWPQNDRWEDFIPPIQEPLPADAIHMLWREELFNLCSSLGFNIPKRANMHLMINMLRWGASGSQLTKGICAALRSRNCIEADAPFPTVGF